MKKDKIIDFTIKKVNRQGKLYYNIVLTIDGMSFQVEPKFLNVKQRHLLKHKIARLMGDEKNEK